MFISKKKFEEALEEAKAQAVKETEERIWQLERMNRMESELHTRIAHLEDRVYQLEYPNGDKVERRLKPIG